MDPELKRQLDEIHALARENHHLLLNVRRHQLIEFFGKWVIYGVLILIGIYFYVEYLMPLMEAYLEAGSAGQGGSMLLPSGELQKLIESYRSGQ